MYMEPDGRFPHHVANPLIPKNTEDLRAMVVEEKADIGIAFDGDADRCGFIDEKGEKIPEDLVTALISQVYLTKSPGATILYDLRSSRSVPETITRLGGRAIRSRVGHAFIKAGMREHDAIFAGELSGHFYFRDAGFTDNAMFAMIQMLNLLALKKDRRFYPHCPIEEVLRDRGDQHAGDGQGGHLQGPGGAVQGRAAGPPGRPVRRLPILVVQPARLQHGAPHKAQSGGGRTRRDGVEKDRGLRDHPRGQTPPCS